MTHHSLSKSKINVVLLGGVHPAAKELLIRDGYTNTTLLERELAGDALLKAVEKAHILGIRSATQIDATVLDQAKKLIALGCFCIGTNQVDVNHAKKLGIPVFNSPYANTRSVAELVIGFMLMLLRGVPAKNAAAHRGEWLKSANNCYEARGKTLGIVGYGHIGTQVGILAEGLGMHVLYHDIVPKLALGNAKSADSLKELLAASDVVTLHVPGGKATEGLIGKKEIGLMKPGALLLNAARGKIIDTPALAEALASGKIGGAAIDVHPKEPKANDEAFVSPLQAFDNVILTPHIGGSTQEAQYGIGQEVAEQLIAYSNAGSTLSAVNFPQAHLPLQEGKHRILHIHKNRPGMMAAINDTMAQAKINISSQYLASDADVGYVIIDIDDNKAAGVFPLLKAIPDTIRSRILY